MADVKDEVEELEELLVGLETEVPMEAYSEDDDAVTLSMAAPIGDQEWMVQLSPTNRKMMSTDRVVTELGLGTLNDTTLVWRGGMEEWMPIAEVEDLTRARSSVPPPRPAIDPAPLPLPAPAPTPPVARAVEAAPTEEASAEDGMADDELDAADADDPTPLVPPSPAEASSDTDQPAPPTRPRSYTGGPVAVDFSSMPPKRPASLRMVLGAGAAAAAMIGVTLFLLSRGGVFETKASSSEGRAVSSLEPAPSTPAEPAAAGAQEPPSGTKPEAAAAPAEAPPAAAPSPTPASPEGAAAEQPAAVASSDAAETEESTPKARASKTRMKPKKRARTALSEPATTTTAEASATETSEAEQVPAKRAKPAARSKTQNVAAKAAAEEPSEAAEEAAAPAPGPTVGFNRQAAKDALKDAAAQAGNCRPAGGPTGNGKVQVRYDATGKVGSVSILTPGFENTTTGSCIQMVFRRAKVASFSGAPVVMTESFEIK